MKEEIKYNELISCLKDENDPLFGGSLAYINIEANLALLVKLIKIKQEKDIENISSYKKIIAVASVVMEEAHEMITKDGEIFSSLRNAATIEKKDEIVNTIFPSSHAFIENLNTIDFFIDKLIEFTKGSIRNDYLMIQQVLKACKANLITILIYEVKKLSSSEEKDKKLAIIEEL